MSPAAGTMTDAAASVAVALDRTGRDTEHVLVRLDGGAWGSVPRRTLEHLAGDGRADRPLVAVVPLPPLPRLHRDHSLETVLLVIGDHPILPVVHRTDPTRLEGVVSVADVLRAYREEQGESHESES